MLTDIYPSEAKIGSLTEVYVKASKNNPFWQPIPNPGSNFIEPNEGIKCKFGKYGQSQATYLNKTTILCLTPNIADDPDTITVSTVAVTVAMNGVDFNDN